MFIYICVQLDVVHGCLHGAYMHVCVFNYVMITCDSQIYDVLVYDMLPLGILVTEHFDKTVENIQNMSLFRCFALLASVIHYRVQKLIYSKRSHIIQ